MKSATQEKAKNLLVLSLLIGLLAVPAICPVAVAKDKPAKPLAGYNTIRIEPFTVEKSEATKDFPSGEEASLYQSAVEGLREAGIFNRVAEGKPDSEAASAAPASPEETKGRLILSGIVIGYSPGNSAARFMTWPLGAGASKVKVRFVFRDVQTGQEVFRTDREGKFVATLSGGIATQQQQLSHVKSAVVEGLIKEIKKNR